MLFQSNFTLREDNREILPLDTEGFQYICKHAHLHYPFDRGFSWHWHAALEIDYIMEGEIEIKTTTGVNRVKKGEGFFVNSNVMHDIHLIDSSKQCEIYAHLFAPEFLSGSYNSVLEQKYLIPIMKSKDLQTFVIRPDHYESFVMLEKAIHMIELSKQESFGYEFKIRSELSDFWCLLFKETEELRSQHIEINTLDTDRLKIMIKFIQDHYMEKLSLEKIAASANISVRECARCFQRCISISPINYLNEYRIRMATQMLLYTEESIMSISENCGFSSSSYMSKVFFDAMHCTPKEYRKKNK
ncbi:MAG: helix-turn-helix domain-containing protein [Coprococcus sp.]